MLNVGKYLRQKLVTARQGPLSKASRARSREAKEEIPIRTMFGVPVLSAGEEAAEYFIMLRRKATGKGTHRTRDAVFGDTAAGIVEPLKSSYVSRRM